MEMSMLQYIGSIGGIAGVLAILIFWAYRHMVIQMLEDRKYMEDRLTLILHDYNEICRLSNVAYNDHTKVMTELIIWLRTKNGGH